jgi:hypothetical protein
MCEESSSVIAVASVSLDPGDTTNILERGGKNRKPLRIDNLP